MREKIFASHAPDEGTSRKNTNLIEKQAEEIDIFLMTYKWPTGT